MNGKCELCGIETKLTKHHLCPKLKSKSLKKQEDDSNIAWICRPCHDCVHATYSESELRDSFNTIEKLLSTEEISKFVSWRRKHPNFSGSSKMSNKRKI